MLSRILSKIELPFQITDFALTSFTNAASLVVGSDVLPAGATVDVTRSASIEKDGKKVTDEKIAWSIDVNKAGGTIKDASVGDAFPVGTTLVPDSIKIFKLTKKGDGTWTESPSDKDASGFPLSLGDLGSEDIYRIKFETKIDYSKVNDGTYQKINKFENVATLKSNKTDVGTAKKTVTIIRKPILEKKGNPEVDYNKKQIKWTVTVNDANHTITNALVTDTLPAGLTIAKSDIKVYDNDNKEITISDDNITITPADNDGSSTTKIEIKLGDITEKYTIEYTTIITDFTINTFENSVGLEGSGVGEGETIPVVPVSPPNNSYTKDFSGIDYAKKEMSWTITVDPTREAIKELTITDTFPNKGLILLPNTLVVKLGTTTLTKGTDYNLSPRTEDGVEGYQKGFTVEFKGEKLPLNNIVTITFKTSFDPQEDVKDKNLEPHIITDPNDEDYQIYKNKAEFI